MHFGLRSDVCRSQFVKSTSFLICFYLSVGYSLFKEVKVVFLFISFIQQSVSVRELFGTSVFVFVVGVIVVMAIVVCIDELCKGSLYLS